MKTLDEVIEGMKCFDPEKECAGCPYEEYHHMGPGIGPSCIDMLARDAVYYLKKAKEPRAKVEVINDTIDGKGPMPFCPHCGDELEWE